MGVLVRALDSYRGGLWAAAEEANRWAGSSFPFEILHDLYDKEGLSFYEMEVPETSALARIAAALLFPANQSKCRSRIESVHFRTVEVSEVQKLGLTAAPHLVQRRTRR
jgi:hypothetical protein